jgi:hypothetical protein
MYHLLICFFYLDQHPLGWCYRFFTVLLYISKIYCTSDSFNNWFCNLVAPFVRCYVETLEHHLFGARDTNFLVLVKMTVSLSMSVSVSMSVSLSVSVSVSLSMSESVSGKSANFHHVHCSAPGEPFVLIGLQGFAAPFKLRKILKFRA